MNHKNGFYIQEYLQKPAISFKNWDGHTGDKKNASHYLRQSFQIDRSPRMDEMQ